MFKISDLVANPGNYSSIFVAKQAPEIRSARDTPADRSRQARAFSPNQTLPSSRGKPPTPSKTVVQTHREYA